MKKQGFKRFVRKAGNKISKHSPEILTGLGIAGMIAAGVFAVKETPKALKKIEEKKDELGVDKLTPVETVQATWKVYAGPVVIGVISAGALISSTAVSTRRTAAFAAAYKLSETAIKEYKDAVIETVGEKKEEAVRQKVAEKKVERANIQDQDIINTGTGMTLFYDPYSDRAFYSDLNTVIAAINKINELMLMSNYDGYAVLNDFYDAVGLEYTKAGNDLGWSITEGRVELCKYPKLIKNETTPCMAIDFRNEPRYDYKRYY